MNEKETLISLLQGKKKDKLIKRFWDKVNIQDGEECWNWTSSLDRRGYGEMSIRINEKAYTVSSHRLSWVLNCGDIPTGLCVLHHCDNPKCVNPRHLFLGTLQDNSIDMWKKDRRSRIYKKTRGSFHWKAKLTKDDVLKIRIYYESKDFDSVQLSKLFGVSPSYIREIANKKAWKHIP